MTAILWLLVLSVLLGAGGLALFLWASRSGQYDDMDGAARRILFDDPGVEEKKVDGPAGSLIYLRCRSFF